MIRAAITGIGAYLPEYVLTNAILETMVDTTDEWITSRTGIEERRILKGKNKGSSEMGYRAVLSLCETYNIDINTIDALICATVTPDQFFPNTANLICDKAGIKNAFCFDLNAACSGFIHGFSMGASLIESGRYKRVLVVGADKMSSITDYTDRSSCILFGDASAAVLLEPSKDETGVLDFELRQNSEGKDYIYMKAGGSALPPSVETLANGDHFFVQQGRHVFRYAVNSMIETTEELLQRNNLEKKDIRFLVPHQANKRIIESIANFMELPMEQVTVNIQRYGNTTSATIPLCLWEWREQFNKGDKLILTAFGAGFNYGSILVEWSL